MRARRSVVLFWILDEDQSKGEHHGLDDDEDEGRNDEETLHQDHDKHENEK